MIKRNLTESLKRSTKSVLLIGPRQTGKSTLIHALKPDLSINLAHEATYLDFARNPSEMESRLAKLKPGSTVFIDEIQRLPNLLNTIQVLIDESKSNLRFYLTGSSARKLRRGNANLLPGRIHAYQMGPLVSSELKYAMDTQQALSTGTLPGIWSESDARERCKTLQSYSAMYLREEIQAEALSRDIQGFSRLLFVLAAEASKFLDLSKLAREALVARQTAGRYFEILEDTLLLRRCDAFGKTDRRRLVQAPRFFFFDTGVLNGLCNNYTVSGDRKGMLFEHLLYNQLADSAASLDEPIRISSYRTEHGAEVDFIVEFKGQVFAIEAKASTNVGKSDLTGLESFAGYYGKPHHAMVAYMGQAAKKLGSVSVLPWQSVLREIGL